MKEKTAGLGKLSLALHGLKTRTYPVQTKATNGNARTLLHSKKMGINTKRWITIIFLILLFSVVKRSTRVNREVVDV